MKKYILIFTNVFLFGICVTFSANVLGAIGVGLVKKQFTPKELAEYESYQGRLKARKERCHGHYDNITSHQRDLKRVTSQMITRQIRLSSVKFNTWEEFQVQLYETRESEEKYQDAKFQLQLMYILAAWEPGCFIESLNCYKILGQLFSQKSDLLPLLNVDQYMKAPEKFKDLCYAHGNMPDKVPSRELKLRNEFMYGDIIPAGNILYLSFGSNRNASKKFGRWYNEKYPDNITKDDTQ